MSDIIAKGGSHRLIGEYGSFNIFEKEGSFYGISKSIRERNVEDVLAEGKAISSESYDALVGRIEDMENWSDSRGMYSLDEEDQSAQILLKANSFSSESEVDEDHLRNPILLKTAFGLILVDEKSCGKMLDNSCDKFDLTENAELKARSVISVGAVPELLFSHGEYNLVEYDKVFYGIPWSLGKFDLTKVDLADVAGIITGETVKAVMQEIDKIQDPSRTDDERAADSEVSSKSVAADHAGQTAYYAQPILLEERELSNVVGFGNSVYELAHSLGEIHLDKLPEEELVQYEIVNYSPSPTNSQPPTPTDEEYAGYLIRHYEGIYVAIPKRLSSIDIKSVDVVSHPEILYDVSADALKVIIDENLS